MTSVSLSFYSHHLLAKVHESKGDFRVALTHEKERYGIYRKQVNNYSPKMMSRFILV